MNNAPLVKLQAAGFTFPAELGKSRHPLLDENGQPRNPQDIGFEPCDTGGNCTALYMMHGKFRVLLTSSDGCYDPDPADWETNLIGVQDSTHEEWLEIVCLSGLEWLEMVNAV